MTWTALPSVDGVGLWAASCRRQSYQRLKSAWGWRALGVKGSLDTL